MEHWYTLHTKPNAEYQVATALAQREIEIYLPELPPSKSEKGRRHRRPFFPCYLFARMDFKRIGFSTIQWTPGLRRVVAFGDEPAAVPDELIALIQQKLSEWEARGGIPAHNFQPGDPVRIKQGPFQDMVAIFDGPATPSQRVQVLLEILGQARRVQLDVKDLEKSAQPDASVSEKRPRRTRGRGRRIASAASSGYPYSRF
jgi:transcriptional antiterminator RfaH